MFSKILNRIMSISLIWKLLIPYAFFSFAGTTILVYIGLSSQEELIRREEKKEILNYYKLFLEKIRDTGKEALSLSTLISSDPRVQKLLAEQNRKGLEDHLLPVFQKLQGDFGIRQFHVHIPPGKSFIRFHIPEVYGEIISYRRTIIDAMKSGKGVAGLEWGISGLGIRGVVPIYHEGVLAGSIEIGYPFGAAFLNELKKNWGPDFTVFEKRAEDIYELIATTRQGRVAEPLKPHFLGLSKGSETLIHIASEENVNRSILAGPVIDYYGSVAGLVEIDVDRSAINERLASTRKLMVLVGIAGICISFFLVWIVASLFTKPIKEIVQEAREIAEEKREIHLDKRPDDEIGMLSDSLNLMLDSLIERRRQIEGYARTLERRVKERTEDLVASEEKYRTLVEHLPLIVYRLLEDGTTEFINPYLSEKLGYTEEEVVGNKRFWREKICGIDEEGRDEVLEACLKEGLNARVERVVKDKKGRKFIFIDQAIPRVDIKRGIKTIEGTMVDITELKALQEKAVRTEEIRLLGEISARFAHEIRNPLATAGGFARRLRDALPEDNKNRQFAEIIVEEVARLEDLLRIILSSLEPLTLNMSGVDMNQLLRSLLADLQDRIYAKGIKLKESLDSSIPNIQGDEKLLYRSLENLLKCAILSVPHGGEISLKTFAEPEKVFLSIRHRDGGLADEDLEQFFFPRRTAECDNSVQDLPLSKIIIHRHGGKIEVRREDNYIVLIVELPLQVSA